MHHRAAGSEYSAQTPGGITAPRDSSRPVEPDSIDDDFNDIDGLDELDHFDDDFRDIDELDDALSL